jgi:hypothetical protein
LHMISKRLAKANLCYYGFRLTNLLR